MDIDKMIDNEVIWCVSYLVDELMTNSTWENELRDIASRPDFIATCEGNDVKIIEVGGKFKFVCPDDEVVSDLYDTEDAAARAAVDELNLVVDEYVDALEFWAVSYYLGNRLVEEGEAVAFDVLDFPAIWGRTCSGQAIKCDHVIQEIVRKANEKVNSYDLRCSK